jgi:polyphosphate glucokinase
MTDKAILGIDIGASGIKGAIVDVESGKLLTSRLKLSTPKPSTTDAVADTVYELVKQCGYEGSLIGVGFPSIVKHGIALSAANIDKSWMGTNIEELFSKKCGKEVIATNDADAAGLSEMRFGKGKGIIGNVLLITIGSGLGSALFTAGHLVRNTEFGHCYFKGMIAEHYVSNTTRKKENLTWSEFGKRFNEFLKHMDRLCSPELIILGGGISNDFELFSEYFDVEVTITPALMFNHAGIIGAALNAYEVRERLF